MNESSSGLSRFIETVAIMSLGRVAIVAVVITGLYYSFVYDDGKALLAKIQTAKTSLANENKKKIETQKVLKKEQQMKADVELLATKFEEVRSKIPLEFLESELRDTVHQHVTKYNLKTVKTERRPQNPRQFTQVMIDAGENLVQQVMLSYELEGTYANISQFVTEISRLEKIIKVGDFNMIISKNPGLGKVRTRDLIFRANIIGYKQTPPDVIKEQELKAKPKGRGSQKR